jgi:hypothetical protein
VRDVVVVRAIKALRDAGCPLSRVRKVKQLVEETWGQDLTATVLFWDGRDVLAVRPWGDVISTLARPGQQVLHFVALPLAEWVEETELRAKSRPVSMDSSPKRPRGQELTGT